VSDERDLFEHADDEAVLPGTGLPGKRRKAFKPSEVAKETAEPVTPAASPAGSSSSSDAGTKSAKKPPHQKPVKEKAASRRGFDWLLLFPLLIVVAAIYGGWQWYQAMLEPALDTVTENRDNLAVLGERQQVVIGQQSELIETIRQQSANEQQWQSEQEQKIAILQKRMNRLDRSARSQALLVEIGGLMRQADRLVRFEKDLPTAAATLRLVDRLLLELDDSGAEYVRGVLANDLQYFNSALSVDRTAVFLQLDAVITAVDGLPLLQTPRTQFVSPAVQVIDPNLSGWQKHWQTIVARLGSLVIVRPREVRDQPMLPPEQSWFLRENLRLQLQQARWAALHAQPEVYARSIQQARDWLDKYFNGESADVMNAREQLQRLAAVSVANPQVDISASQKALASYRLEMSGDAREANE